MRVYEQTAYELINLYQNPPHSRTRNSPLYKETMTKVELMLSDLHNPFHVHSPVVREVAQLLTAHIGKFSGSEREQLESKILRLNCFGPARVECSGTIPSSSILLSTFEEDDSHILLFEQGWEYNPLMRQGKADDADWDPFPAPKGSQWEDSASEDGMECEDDFVPEEVQMEDNDALPEQAALDDYESEYGMQDDYSEFDPRLGDPRVKADDEWSDDSDDESEEECIPFASPLRDCNPVVYYYIR